MNCHSQCFMEGTALRSCRTRALLAVSHVGSTALRVTVPAVTTCGKMAPYCPSSSKSSCLMKEQREGQTTSDVFTQKKKTQQRTPLTNRLTVRGSSALRSHTTFWELQRQTKIRDFGSNISCKHHLHIQKTSIFKRDSNLMRF